MHEACTVYQRINNLVPVCLHCALNKHRARQKRKAWWALSVLCRWPRSQLKSFHQRQFWGYTNFRLRRISFSSASVKSWRVSVDTLFTAIRPNESCSLICPNVGLDHTWHDQHALTSYHTALQSRSKLFNCVMIWSKLSASILYINM